MGLPTDPVILSAEKVADLNRKFSALRHDINNHLSLIIAGLELARYRPETSERMLASAAEQPPKITEALKKFSSEFEAILRITRP